MTLCVVVCQNGLGHFRRVTQILHRLLSVDSELKPVLLCGDWQHKRMIDDAVVRSVLARCQVIAIDGHPLRLISSEEQYDAGALTKKAVDALAVDAVFDSDVVWSDNVSSALVHRPDTILSGSFLWSDVLAERVHDDEAQRFVQQERALLEEARPDMICVDAFCMPSIRSRTNAIGVPPMVDADRERAPQGAKEVGFMPGATGLLEGVLKGAADSIRAAGRRVRVPAVWTKTAGETFRFARDSWAVLGAAVIRPGLGAIHDCLASCVPIVAVRERGNAELLHNAERIAALGVGVMVDADSRAIAAGVDRVLANPHGFRAQIDKLGGGGIGTASRYIAARLNGLSPAAQINSITGASA